MTEKLLEAMQIFAMIVFDYALCIVLHEMGHLCMGKVAGYELISFRIGHIKILRKNGKWALAREHVPGTLGQCVMLPPETNEPEKMTAIPYHLGGGLFNLLTAAGAVPFYCLAGGKFGKSFFLILAVLSAAFALINLYPAKIITPNDGYNIKLALKNPDDRKAMYHMLQILGCTEMSLGEMPESFFELCENGEYSGTMKLMNAIRFLDLGDLEKAEELFREVYSDTQKTSPYYRMEAKKEMLFCMLLKKAPADAVAEVYDDELKKYLNDKRNRSAGNLRVLCAYDHLISMNEEEAKAEYREAMELLKNASARDAKMERRLINRINLL